MVAVMETPAPDGFGLMGTGVVERFRHTDGIIRQGEGADMFNRASTSELDEAAALKYSLGDYILVNLIVWGILFVIGVIAYFGIDRAPVVPFLLVVVGSGFTIVSIYDGVYDRIARRSEERDRAGS